MDKMQTIHDLRTEPQRRAAAKREDDAFIAAMRRFKAGNLSDEPEKPQKVVIRDVINIATCQERRAEVVEALASAINLSETIIQACCYAGKIRPSEIKSPRRHANIVKWRQICMWLMRKHTSMSLPAIGKRIGGRDHSTVHHGCKKIDADYETYRKDIELVESFL